MKELEKTKRISIAAVLTILAVIIGLLTFQRPKFLYDKNAAEALAAVSGPDYMISLKDLGTENQLLIDIRNRYDYKRGHLENAIHIDAPELLENKSWDLLQNEKNANKTIVLSGNTPSEAVTPYMLLKQLGFDNVKVLTVNIGYDQYNKLVAQETSVETALANIDAFLKASVRKSDSIMAKTKIHSKPKPEAQPVQKTVIPVKKKKKAPVEGGC